MDPVADLQAQIVALRTAVEGIWLSLMSRDPDAAANAARLRQGNIDALNALHAPNAQADAMRQAVIRHTDQLWGSIIGQLGEPPQT